MLYGATGAMALVLILYILLVQLCVPLVLAYKKPALCPRCVCVVRVINSNYNPKQH